MKTIIMGILLMALFSVTVRASVNVIPEGEQQIQRAEDVYGTQICQDFLSSKKQHADEFLGAINQFLDGMYANDISKEENIYLPELGVYTHDEAGVRKGLTKRVGGFVKIAKKLGCTAIYNPEAPLDFITLKEGCDFSKLSSTIEWLYGFKIYMYENQYSNCFTNKKHNIFAIMLDPDHNPQEHER